MFDDLIQAASAKWQVPVPWIQAVIETESSWSASAYREEPQINDASYGLMQLLYKTAKSLGYSGAPEGLFQPGVNIDLGTKLLSNLRKSYGDDFRRVYSAYNSGNPDAWETSSQVAANVARALVALERYVGLAVGVVTQSPGAAIAVLVAFVLFWTWGGGRPPKKKK